MQNRQSPPSQLPVRHRLARSACALILGVTALAATSHVMAAGPKSGGDDATYKKERAACMDGTSNQDRATCLREAGAARYEAGRGQLSNPGEAQLQQNAQRRCEGLPQAQRSDCEARMNGAGVSDGSARDGGIYRETRTITTN
ncbi:hypothetical protein [Herbaspirillum sp. alder98]|uniref:hypothetical protein n=1 Tax=Herbaspirillum sp. alder98 TaxID=2913096 RepID=UPI001CD8A2E6|nr:hypothetical protein [Herbaspirillum sp. alder98]MCA1324424.1 hypothetical protein [Herbaspirillum sp. alder98]